MKSTKNYILFVFLSFFTLLSCVKDESSTTTIQESLSGEEIFSGIFFFNKDFVGDIPILERSNIHNLINDNPTISSNLFELNDLIISNISNSNPLFFEEFRSSMTSGNHYQVAESLEKASYELFESMDDLFGEQKLSAEEFSLLMSEGNIQEIINDEGEIDQDILAELFDAEEASLLSFNSDSAGKCLFGGVVIIAVAYVFVVAVAGALVGINVAAAVNVAGAVNAVVAANVEVYGDINFSTEEEIQGKGNSAALQKELLIDQLTSRLSR